MQIHPNPRPRLILLSDLWGSAHAAWITGYKDALAAVADTHWYDCRELGAVDTQVETESDLHAQFREGGIDRAVAALVRLEPGPVHVLGFSVGGYIGWKACQAGMQVHSFCAVSSTRLRVETQPLPCPAHLFYGEADGYRPAQEWFAQMGLHPQILPGEAHEMYRKPEIAAAIAAQVRTALIAARG